MNNASQLIASQYRIAEINKRIWSNIIFNVKDNGAVGDGVSDDTEAIQKTIDDATQAGGGNVYLPPGTYRITQSLSISFILEFSGETKELSTIFAEDCNGLICEGYTVCLHDFAIKTNRPGVHNGLILSDSNYNIIADIWFAGVNPSTDYWSTAVNVKNMWYSKIDALLIQGGQINVHYRGRGIKCDYSVNNVLSQCVIESSDICIHFTDVPRPVIGHFCEGWKITQNTPISSNIGVKIDKGLFYSITDNMFDFQQQYGILIDVPLQGGGVITNNWIAMQGNFAGASAIRVNNSDRLIIANNLITGTLTAGQFGVYINGRFLSLSANSIVGNDKGVYVTNLSEKVNIDGNTFISNTRDIEYYGHDGVVNGNSPGASVMLATPGNSYQTKSKYSITAVKVLVGGANTEIIDIALPPYAFSTKPLTGWINVNGNNPLVGNYLMDDAGTTANNARFMIRHQNTATNIPAGPVRFSILLSDADVT